MKTLTLISMVLCICNSQMSFAQSPYEDEEICIVTVDTALNKNKIVWEKTYFVGTSSFNIYRETNTPGVYGIIGTVPFNDPGIFIDQTSDPSVSSDLYKISVVETNGIESDLSSHHKTLHLIAVEGSNELTNLIWENYEGFAFLKYKIYKGTTISNLQILDSIPNIFFSYTDLDPLTGHTCYLLEAIQTTACYVDGTEYSSSISNVFCFDPTSVKEKSSSFTQIYSFPNPIVNTATIQFNSLNPSEEVNFTLLNAQGKEVNHYSILQTGPSTLEFNRKDLDKGIYIYKISDNNSIIGVGKLVLQ